MRTFYHPAREQIELASVLYALSDPVRLSIVETLSGGGEVSCGEFGMDLPKSTVSHHFRVLREAGVTKTRAQSTRVFLSLRRDDLEARFPGLLDSIVSANRKSERGRARAAARKEVSHA